MTAPKSFTTENGTYTWVDDLGSGGAGRVVEVIDHNGAAFALKYLLPERIDADRVKRFRNELEFCRTSSHLRILRVLDAGTVVFGGTEAPFYVAKRYAKTLRKHLRAGLPPDRLLPTFCALLDGVEAAHLQGVWHRDLKPENVLCDDVLDEVVIADFGIAHFGVDLLATHIETSSGDRLGNFSYAAPEQRAGTGADERSDIFALGLILNELFTKRLALGTSPLRIGAVAPQYATLDGVVDRMMQNEASARFQSIAEVRDALLGDLRGPTETADRARVLACLAARARASAIPFTVGQEELVLAMPSGVAEVRVEHFRVADRESLERPVRRARVRRTSSQIRGLLAVLLGPETLLQEAATYYRTQSLAGHTAIALGSVKGGEFAVTEILYPNMVSEALLSNAFGGVLGLPEACLPAPGLRPTPLVRSRGQRSSGLFTGGFVSLPVESWPPALQPDQGDLLERIARHWEADGTWPVRTSLRIELANEKPKRRLNDELKRLPPLLWESDRDRSSPTERIALTVYGVAMTAAGEPAADALVRLFKLGVARYVADPFAMPTVTSSDLREVADHDDERVLNRLGRVVFSALRASQLGDDHWSWQPGLWDVALEDVTDIWDYGRRRAHRYDPELVGIGADELLRLVYSEWNTTGQWPQLARFVISQRKHGAVLDWLSGHQEDLSDFNALGRPQDLVRLRLRTIARVAPDAPELRLLVSIVRNLEASYRKQPGFEVSVDEVARAVAATTADVIRVAPWFDEHLDLGVRIRDSPPPLTFSGHEDLLDWDELDDIEAYLEAHYRPEGEDLPGAV